MGVERFEDSDDRPSQEAEADLPRDTGGPGDADRSRETPQSDEASRPEEPAPDNSPTREPSERADAEAKPAESRTRSEYADHVAPAGSPPIEGDSPKRETERPSHPEHEFPEPTMPEEPPSEAPASHQHQLEQPLGPDDTVPSDDRSVINDDAQKQRDVPEDRSNFTIGIGKMADGDNDLRDETAEESVAGPEIASSEGQSSAETDASDTSPSNDPLIHQTIPNGMPEDAATTSSELDEDYRRGITLGAKEQPDSWYRQDDRAPEDSTRPLSREQRAEHITDVLDRLEKAEEAGLSAEELHTVDPAGEIWSTERTLQHGSLLADLYDRAAGVPCEHKAVIAGGLSGAGKTTVLASHPEIDRSQYLTINPDDIKEEMARRNMIPEVEGLSPMEASDLVHEESSYLARQLALRAQADGKNLIWDITMSDLQKTEKRIQDLRDAGYTRIEGIFVHIPIETSLRRTEERYWTDQEKWLAGQGIGGRLVPPDVILRQKDDEWGSGNRKTFETIKQTFESWEIRDNSVDDHPSVLIGRGQKEQ